MSITNILLYITFLTWTLMSCTQDYDSCSKQPRQKHYSYHEKHYKHIFNSCPLRFNMHHAVDVSMLVQCIEQWSAKSLISALLLYECSTSCWSLLADWPRCCRFVPVATCKLTTNMYMTNTIPLNIIQHKLCYGMINRSSNLVTVYQYTAF